MAGDRDDPNIQTPLWVKVQGAFVVLLILVVAAMSTGFLGAHGPDHGALQDHQQHMGRH
jgi:Mg/Co/Ni transporter MgtE